MKVLLVRLTRGTGMLLLTRVMKLRSSHWTAERRMELLKAPRRPVLQSG